MGEPPVDTRELQGELAVCFTSGAAVGDVASVGRWLTNGPSRRLAHRPALTQEDRLNAYRNYVNCPESTEKTRQLEEESVKAQKVQQLACVVVRLQRTGTVWPCLWGSTPRPKRPGGESEKRKLP